MRVAVRWSFLFAVFLTVVLTGHARAEVFAPETFTLDNGLRVVVISNHRAPVVSHMVFYHVGAADEPPGQSGIAHFLEHLMFKGTESAAPGEFSRQVAAHGGSDNAFTSWDYTGYVQNVPKDALPLVMRYEADRMTGLKIPEADFLAERDVILEERRQVVDSRPIRQLGEQLRAAMYQNHPYGIPIIGWENEIASLTHDAVMDFYRRYYMPNNAVLLVAGDVDADEVRELAEKYYGPVPPGEPVERVRPQEPEHKGARLVEFRDDQVGQARWLRYYLAPSYTRGATEHAYPLQVLAELLGGSETSRLYRRLVHEERLAISAGAGYDAISYDLSEFSVYAQPRDGVTIDEIEAAMEREIDRLLADGVTADEVARAKNRLTAAAIYARDSLSTGIRVLGLALTSGHTIDGVESWPERIDAVTVEEVDAAARAVFNPRMSVTGLLLPTAENE